MSRKQWSCVLIAFQAGVFVFDLKKRESSIGVRRETQTKRYLYTFYSAWEFIEMNRSSCKPKLMPI